jgi:ketosteroid isomerase-like protein
MIDPVALLKKYHVALGAFDLDAVEKMFAEDAIYISPGLKGEIKGRGLIMRAMREYFLEFDDQISTDESLEAIDHVTAKSIWHLCATSSKTGEKLTRSGVETIVFDNNGLINRIKVTDQV